ncbi:MAG TPA: hypothetical protein VKB05_16960 [Pyrinomonadaceae bacterium]|nr:hypothetical protein [Pyrinomonadaceae bacterium]
MKPSLQIVGRDKLETLPVLATATDIREAIRFLKHHPDGITTVQAMDAARKRIFDARKVSAYEFWKILLKNGERLKLTPLGWELAQCLNPEAEIFRLVLNDTPAYHSGLEWISEQDLELVTHLEIGEFWRQHHPHVLQGDSEEQLEAHAASFFHICHEAEVGALTVGRKGQPTRLHIYPHELDTYLRGIPASNNNSEKIVVRKGPSHAPRVFISHATTPALVKHIVNGLELADLQFETVDRTEQWSIDKTLAVLRRCEAGVMVITGGVIDDQLLIQIGAAMVQFERRLLLVVKKGLSLPLEIVGAQRCEVEDQITWDTGLELMRALKKLKVESS